jgi:phosphoglycerate dehydrogenase-like enzyme
LVTGRRLLDRHRVALEGAGLEVVARNEVSRSQLVELLVGTRYHVLGGDERVDADILRAAGALEVVAFVGTGAAEFVDEDAALACGVRVTTTPGVNSAAVAEHTAGLVVGLARGLFAHNDHLKRGGEAVVPGVELRELRVGIVGMGASARATAQILVRGFGCRVAYANRTRRPAEEADLGLEWLPRHELVRSVDVLVLLVARTSETVSMIGSRELAEIQPGLLLVNTAAADLVEPGALRAALDNGRVAAAAFDGYWIEPLPSPADDPYHLLSLPDRRFVVSPHRAGATTTAWDAMLDAAVASVIAAEAAR